MKQKIALVGHPNVGKSAMFNRLTGAYVHVANYPGTTVEVARGKTRIGTEEFEVIDTLGMYSFLPITEEERIARNLLMDEKPEVVIHIVDAKNLERMLGLTLEMAEAGLSVLLGLNMMDEAAGKGIEIDVDLLEKRLAISVVATVSTTGEGIDLLKERIQGRCRL